MLPVPRTWTEADYAVILDADFTPDEQDSLWAIDELMSRPSMEEAFVLSSSLQSELITALDGVLGAQGWTVEEPYEGTGRACRGIYEKLPRHTVTTRASTDTVLDDAQWESAAAVFAAFASAHGYVVSSSFGDLTHNHSVTFYAPDLSDISLVSRQDADGRAYTVLSMDSPCYFNEEDRATTRTYGVPLPSSWAAMYPTSPLSTREFRLYGRDDVW